MELIARAAAARAADPVALARLGGPGDIVFVLRVTAEHAASGTRLQGCLNLVDLADK